jgi:hypothetical protein
MAEQVNLLELIRQQSPRVVQAVQNAGAVAVDNSIKAEKVVADIEKTYQQAAEDQALVVRTAQVGQLQAQQASRKALDAAGGLDALYDTISTLRAEQVRLTPELEKLREENIDATGFNILGKIRQALDWNGTQAKVASSVNTIKTVSNTGQEIEQRVGAAGTTAKNTAETMTTASVAAAARMASVEWQGRAAQARLEALKYNSATMDAIAGAEDKTLEVLMRAQNAERSEQSYQLALQEAQRQRDQFEWRKEEAAYQRADREEKLIIDNDIVAKINAGRASRGLEPLGGLEAKQVISMFKSNNPDMLDLYKKGELALRTGISFIGYSPSDTARVVATNPQILESLPAERKKALALVLEAQQALAVARGVKGSDLSDDKDGTKSAAFVNDYVRRKVGDLSMNVGNNFDNPFHIGDLSSYIGSAAAPGVSTFQNYPTVQKILNPAIAANISLSDPNTVVGLVQAAVRKGDLTSSQAAADITNIYRRANLIHRKAVGFETIGVSVPAAGKGYMARINGELVDVTDFTAVARAMNIQMLREAARGSPMVPGVRADLAGQRDRAIFGIGEEDRLRRQVRQQNRSPALP